VSNPRKHEYSSALLWPPCISHSTLRSIYLSTEDQCSNNVWFMLRSIQMASYLQYLDSSVYHFLPSLYTNTTIIPHTHFIPYCFYSPFINTQYYDISQYVYYNIHTA
jgi:hypothetical protein